MPEYRRLVVVAGTGVPPIAAPLLYRQFARLSPVSKVFALPRLGLGHSHDAALDLAPRIHEYLAGEGDVLGDSQGGYPAINYAYNHPDEVRHLVLLSVPLDGTGAARIIDTAGTRCMRPGSRYIDKIRGMAKELAEYQGGPRIICISSGHDYLVPWESAFLHAHADNPRVVNICVGHSGTKPPHPSVRVVPVRYGAVHMHLSEVFLRGTSGVVAVELGYAAPVADASFDLTAKPELVPA